MMKWVAVGFILVAAAERQILAQDTDRPIQPAGEFSNLRLAGEHAYGYSVKLWRDGRSLIGLLLVSEGLQGDTPTGLLEDVTFDPATGALAFSARLTTGVTYAPAGSGEPNLARFVFTGVMRDSSLTGTMRQVMLRPAGLPADSREVKLSRQSTDSAVQPATTYAEWKRAADQILALRGPK
jgi:hypothetical protein